MTIKCLGYKSATFVLSFFFCLLIQNPVHAQSVIQTDDSYSSININNSTGGITTNGSSTTTSESHVRIETNGNVQEFHSTGDDINYESEDGSVKVNINNNGEEETKTEVTRQVDVSETSSKTETENKTLESETETIKEVLSAEDINELIKEEVAESESLPTNQIIMSIASIFPTPFGQVQNLFTLIQSAVYLL